MLAMLLLLSMCAGTDPAPAYPPTLAAPVALHVLERARRHGQRPDLRPTMHVLEFLAAVQAAQRKARR